MAHLTPDNRERAAAIVALYPHKRSALLPLCHLAQAQDGWLTPEAIEDIAGLLDLSPAEVEGTASFYDMLHTEPVGRYLVDICTNVACMLAGAYDLLAHAEERLGVPPGETTPDGLFTLEEAECVADCANAPCVQVNHRFFGRVDAAAFDALVEDLRAGRLDEVVPPHGVLSRVEREVGLVARTDATPGEPGGPAGGRGEGGAG
jgi:NADH-quinone oxidoreductase subunit E